MDFLRGLGFAPPGDSVASGVSFDRGGEILSDGDSATLDGTSGGGGADSRLVLRVACVGVGVGCLRAL